MHSSTLVPIHCELTSDPIASREKERPRLVNYNRAVGEQTSKRAGARLRQQKSSISDALGEISHQSR